MNAPLTLLTDDLLRAQVKLLGTLLGQVLQETAGEGVFDGGGAPPIMMAT